jgi:citrate lyase subunit beta/citryl-CoA lyase
MKKEVMVLTKAVRSMLYIPGNNPGMIQSCSYFGADSVLLDIEDAVAISEKDAARNLVAHALATLDFGDVYMTVRINGADTPFFEKDLETIIPSRPDAVRLPKTQQAKDVMHIDEIITKLEKTNNIEPGTIAIHAMLETAKGIINAVEIANASPRVKALTLGGQDLAADIGVQRTKKGTEILYARSAVVMAAKSAAIQVFDTVYTDINDSEGLLDESRFIVSLGFTGKAAIHPSQIPVIHEAFRPSETEVRKALRVVYAAREADQKGIGVYTVDGKMVDGPVVRQFEKVVELAKLAGMEIEGIDEI